MAQFEPAFSKLMKWEGGYSNHKADTGGETFNGISRNNWPNWEGWKVIDSGILADTLKPLVRDFYRENFWDKIRGCEIDRQALADVVFSTAVHAGVRFAVRKLQTILEIKADGIIGPVTLMEIGLNDATELTNEYCEAVGEFYRSLVQRKPSQVVFLNGWMNRIRDYRVVA